jgi:hypothetical protein
MANLILGYMLFTLFVGFVAIVVLGVYLWIEPKPKLETAEEMRKRLGFKEKYTNEDFPWADE